ncbi:hypothetical protein RHGRI_031257 [Rhododendron griersonianum]|uniref:DNA helicase Pif1-like 2B domain-containing protein n=1 Tax=Rhododendron griersonianum TaxID=479676 RepID=A0AAV6IBX1_9ERIC|nr:hypothetical protein RHGRI_031257 [Rhododendron griersonianum]
MNAINGTALNIFPGNRYTYLAADKLSEDDGMDRSITNRYPNEYLNSLDPTGLPPFKLELKVGCPIILFRNIAPKDGLCNGTRMMVVKCGSRIIEVLGVMKTGFWTCVDMASGRYLWRNCVCFALHLPSDPTETLAPSYYIDLFSVAASVDSNPATLHV